MKKFQNFKAGLVIVPDYESLIPPMSKTDYNNLFASIKEDGVIIDPLVINQDGELLDGHHRYKIARELDLDFKTTTLNMKNKTAGKLWIIDHQLASRRMTKLQLAILGLGLIPFYKKICKDKQSEGGKTKEKTDIGIKTSEMVAKKIGINETAIKHIKSLNDNEPDFVKLLKASPLIEGEAIVMKEAKFLQKAKKDKLLNDITEDGLLTDTAKELLHDYRNPPQTPEQLKAADAKEKLRLAKVESDDAEKKAVTAKKAANTKIINKAAKAKFEEEKEEDKENSGGDEIQGNNENNGTGGESDIEPSGSGAVKKLTPEDEKVQKDLAELTAAENFVDELINEVKTGKVFKGKANLKDCLNDIDSAHKFAALYIKRDTNKSDMPNIIIAISNSRLNNPDIRFASASSTSMCDCKDHCVRLLYYGTERNAFYRNYHEKGLILMAVNQAPQDIKPKIKTRAAKA